MASAKNIVRRLIENTDPDSPESFGVDKHFDSPVARIAATSGFKRSRVSNEERWVKELSNGKEVWLRTIADRGYEIPMDFQKGRGGREWELVEMTKEGNRYTNTKTLIRTNEVAMTYVLGAFLQRLATWPADVPKPTVEGLDDPDTVLQTFEPRYMVISKIGPYQPKKTYWGGWGRPDATGRGLWHNSPLDANTFTQAEAEREVEALIQNYINTAGYDRAAGESRVGVELMSPVLMDKWRKQRARNAARRKKPVVEDIPVPDPDDPTTAVSSFVKSKTPYFPDYAKLARYIESNRENVYVSGRVTRHGCYVHENSTTFELNIESNDLPDEIAVLANVVEKMIGEEIVRINKKIYRALEREWDSRNTDEYIDEWLGEQTDDRYNALGHSWDADDDADEPPLSFAQLDDSAKATARDIHRNSYDHDEWWDYIYEEWKTELTEMGFGDPDISFSGFSSQGDGASFTAKSFDFMKWAEWFMSNKPVERGHPYTDDLPVTESDDLDDPKTVLQNFEPRFLVVSKVGEGNPKETYWGGKAGPLRNSGNGTDYWHNSPLDARTFTQAEAEAELKYLVGIYRKIGGWNDPDIGYTKVGIKLASPALMDRWKKQRERNARRKAARQKPKLAEAMPVPDPDDPQTEIGLNSDQHVVESGPDDPATFMASLDQMPDHELINTSSPPPETSRSVTCVCGTWGFSGIARNAAEQAEFDEAAKIEYAKHIQFPHIDTGTTPPYQKLHVRNLVTKRRLKEGVDDPQPPET